MRLRLCFGINSFGHLILLPFNGSLARGEKLWGLLARRKAFTTQKQNLLD